MNSTAIENDYFFQSSVILPAIMTLICFICTVMSLTVAGFICLRDREAKDENEIMMKQQREDEFVTKAVSLFYNVRTFNVFRVNEIIEDKNENKPAWVSRKEDVIKTLQVHGVFLSENEDKELSSLSDVFEIDTEALLYLELERFSKAIAVYGEDTLKYYPSITQDGMVFRMQFMEDKREIYESHLIYTIFREMRQITELFVLLLTGIDAGFLSNKKLPEQFKMCLMKEELCSLEDFFYNYYHRLYSQSGFRPNADLLQTMHVASLKEKRSLSQDMISSQDSVIETDSQKYEEKPQQNIMTKVRKAYHAVQAAQKMVTKKRRPSTARPNTPVESKPTAEYQTETISEPATFEIGIKEEDEQQQPQQKQQQQQQLPQQQQQLQPQQQQQPTSLVSPSAKSEQQKFDFLFKKQEVEPEKLPPKLVKNPWSRRRRGKLKRTVNLEKNAFTYMVFKVLECLKGNKIEVLSYETKQYNQVDRNFII